MLKTGMIIAERYEILAKIGTGGMADVYKAKDHKLNRFVAFKVLKPEFREDTTFIRKFKSEAQAAAGLTHPNIVNIYDVGDDEGVYYIVMELIEGITLKEYISKKGKLSVKEATSIAIQVSMGLEAAHNHNIVHRDVKPQNIIISTDGKVKVTDFGIARAASSNTISSNVMGSVHYSSPEQVRGGYSDEKSDIYSLGITIYEMVTGRVPFDGDTTVAIAIKHLQEEMAPPSSFAPDLPYSLEQIIYKCTQKSVDRRYAKMEDVIADLKHSLIDPQGDFVKLNAVDTVAKTQVIPQKEVEEQKHVEKQKTVEKQKPQLSEKEEIEQLEKELRREEIDYNRQKEEHSHRPHKKKKKRKSHSRLLSMLLLILGAAALIGLIVFLAQRSGLLETARSQTTEQATATPVPKEEESTVSVPDVIGKTEDEARAILTDQQLGMQMMGEEISQKPVGTISRTEPEAGTAVEPNSTVHYYISQGNASQMIPYMDGMTAIEAQELLESMSMTVQVDKQYSPMGIDGYAEVEPGYLISVDPAEGTVVDTGSTVHLVVSRGIDYGAAAMMPNVIGKSKNDALTTLGKFIDINIEEQQSETAPVGEVLAQSVEPDTLTDPDQPITITISCGNVSPEEAAAAREASQQTNAAETAAVAAGEVWKCDQRLNTPEGYEGGLIRLELVQDVGGQPSASLIVDGEVLEFPYQLDLTGTPGVSQGTIYIYEQKNGNYEELGHYSITFEKVS